jgi:hypothetical protein
MGTRQAWRVRLVMLGAVGLLALAGCIGESTRKDTQDKLDPALKLAIQSVESATQPAPRVDVLIRTRDEIDIAQHDALESSGARIGSVMGDVLTASVPLRAVNEIASLDFVVYIEMSKQQRLR